MLPYRFTGKEYDEETGYYYFGARYYDATFSSWISTDPAFDGYLPSGKELYFPEKAFNANNLKGSGGVFNSHNLNLYHYSSLNPITYFDPDGRASYLVARGLNYTIKIPVVITAGQMVIILDAKIKVGDLADHMYVVTNADHIGDKNAKVFSFGKRADGTMGLVNNPSEASDFSKTTHEADKKHWESLNDKNSNGIVSKINAKDEKVADTAQKLKADKKYDPTGMFSVNSNSAAQAVADRAQGSPTETPSSQPGTIQFQPGSGSAKDVTIGQ